MYFWHECDFETYTKSRIFKTASSEPDNLFSGISLSDMPHDSCLGENQGF